MAYIDTEKLKRNIRVNLMPNVDADGTVTVENAERYFLNLIEKTSTADVIEVKHGEWIYKHRHRGGFERRTAYDEFNNPHTVTLDNRYECDEPYCSVCGKLGGGFLNYCGNCGAKMDGGKAE